jgi:hypothetical protein
MLPGHNKFPPDNLFSRIARTYYTSDVMITDDLIKIAGKYAQCHLATAHDLGAWSEVLKENFNKITGIKSYRDFKISTDQFGHVSVMAKSRCYEGEWANVTENFVMIDKEAIDAQVNLETSNYYTLKHTVKLSEAKLTDLNKCAAHVSHKHKWFYVALQNENEQYGDLVEDTRSSEQNQTIASQVMDEFTVAK